MNRHCTHSNISIHKQHPSLCIKQALYTIMRTQRRRVRPELSRMIVFTPFQPRMTPLLGSAEVQKALDKCALFRYTRGKGVRCPEMCKQEATSRRKARKERP